MIVDARSAPLEPDEAAELSLLTELLGDPSMWAEPSAGLEDEVMRAVADAPAAPIEHKRRPRRAVYAAVAVAAALMVAFGVGAAVVGTSANPDYKAQMRAGGIVPGASATAKITRNGAGFRVTLDASGLPSLASGEYYQAWLKNPATKTSVPVGTFSSSDGKVTLWSGVSPQEFSMITVTLEKADNDQNSSGRLVLVGPVVPR